MRTIAEQLVEIARWDTAISESFKREKRGREDFYRDNIIRPWFEEIAPQRTVSYGTEALYRFGPRGVVAQIFNCYYRWKQLKSQGLLPDHSDQLLDVLRDTFGFAVLMGISCFENPDDPGLWGWSQIWRNPARTYDLVCSLEDGVWRSGNSINAAGLSFSLAHNMWIESR